MLPIVALWFHRAITAYSEYEGNCGLLGRGYVCTPVQYIEESLTSVFVFPVLAFWSVFWIIVVAVLAFLLGQLQNGRKDPSIRI